jgi:hypothetical protein
MITTFQYRQQDKKTSKLDGIHLKAVPFLCSLSSNHVTTGYTNVLKIKLKCPENVLKSTLKLISLILSSELSSKLAIL